MKGAVLEGDSGAWVVHAAASELYGHVVATSVFGDAYVMPATDTLENIRQCLGATLVCLPNEDDFEDYRPYAETQRSRGLQKKAKRYSPKRRLDRCLADYGKDEYQVKSSISGSIRGNQRVNAVQPSCLGTLKSEGAHTHGLSVLYAPSMHLQSSWDFRTAQTYFARRSQRQWPDVARALVREESKATAASSKWRTAEELRAHLNERDPIEAATNTRFDRQFM